MKKNLLLLLGLCLFSVFTVKAQVLIDKEIQLTGSAPDARLTGIQTVQDSLDATNVKTVQNGNLIYAADTSSTANSYSIPLSPAIPAYAVGMVVDFKANLANTDTIVTLSVNGLAAAPIMKNYNSYLAVNDIQSGQMVIVMYDGANWQMLSQVGNVTPEGNNNNNAGDPTLIYTTDGF